MGGTATGLADSTAYLGPGAGQWATKGYAVLQLTARGFGDSCGRTARTAETPAHFAATCAKGYVHLDDERYEAHDVQYASGLLADAGIVNPAAIGVTGPSYGGGVSLELATLKDRVMNANGTLSPWRSPAGSSRAASSAPYARARIRSSCSREALGAGSCAAAWTSPPAISRSSSTRSTLFTSTTTVSRHAVVAATR